MGLIFCDGFEIAFAQNNAGLWDSTSIQSGAYFDHAQSGGRTGKFIRFQQDSSDYAYLIKNLDTAIDEIYGCIAVRISTNVDHTFGTYNEILRFLDSATGNVHIGIGITENTNTLAVTRGYSTLIAGPSTTSLMPGTWHFIRFHFSIANSGGVCWVELDGTTEIDTTADTLNDGDGLIGSVAMGEDREYDSSHYTDFDDFAIRDDALPASGSSVYQWKPTSDVAGADWAYSSGTSLWQILDSDPPGTANYVYGGTVDHAFLTSGTTNMLSASTIEGVQVYSYDWLNSSGERYFGHVISSGGSVDSGGSIYLSVSPTINLDVWDVNPDGSAAWDLAAVNSLQVGGSILA